MTDEITLQGKRYRLIPLEEETGSILDGYKIQKDDKIGERNSGNGDLQRPSSGEVKDAVPKVFDYKEKSKIRQERLTNRRIQIKKMDSTLDDFGYKGDKLFFGEGLQSDIY